MKKTYKKALSLGLGMALSTGAFSQIINESFDDITTIATTGWVMNNLSTPIGTAPNWVQGVVGGAFDPYAGAGFVQGNFNNVAGTGTISNWLISPARAFNNGDIVSFYTRTVNAPTYADRMQFRLSLNGTSTNVGTTNTSVGDFTTLLQEINPTQNLTAYPSLWTKYTYTVSGLSGATAGRFAFRYYVTNGGPTGTASDNIGIDNFVYTPLSGVVADLVTTKNPMPYTVVPLAQVSAVALTTTITNVGFLPTSDAILKAEVFQLPNTTVAIQSATSAATSLAVNASASFTLGAFTPTAVGSYLIRYTSNCTNNNITSADTAAYTFAVSSNEYAKDDGVVSTALGIGAGPVGYIGSMFKINATTKLDSVLIALRKPGSDNTLADGIGDSTKVVVYNVVSGLPSTIIGKSPKYVFTAADTSVLVVSIHKIWANSGGVLTLTPGDYFVAVAEYKTNVGLAVSDNVFKNNTCFASWPAQAWAPIETFGAGSAKTPIIRPLFVDCTGLPAMAATTSNTLMCVGQTASLTATGATSYTWNTSATGSVIAVSPSINTTYTVSGMNLNGCLNYTTVTQDVQVCTGLNALTQQSGLNVFPNPTTSFLNVEFAKATSGATYKLELVSALGQVVLSESLTNQNITLKTKQLLEGVYFLNVIENNRVISTQKVIKN